MINIKFEEMSIPIKIDQLSKLKTYENNSSELINWFKANRFDKIFQLSKFLEYPVFKQEGFSNQILRSWMGRKLLTQLSRTIIIPNDKNGIQLFNTIENLLEKNNQISTLDILKEIPNDEIELDVDNLILIISYWKKELEDQHTLLNRLSSIKETNKNLIFNFEDKTNDNNLIYSRQDLFVYHREKPLRLEIWKPKINIPEKDLIIFMPGLGGDISNFRWLCLELSKRGWPIIFIEHHGSDSEAFKSAIKGKEALPGGADIFLYRLKDLDAVINANRKGYFGLEDSSYILMGHSLGTLISFLYEGNLPKKGFETRCDKALVDFALTNISKLLQCQLSEIPIPEFNNSSGLKSIVGFSGFGSLIWPSPKTLGIDKPILLIGGTYDLITPLVSEQFKIFLANKSNKYNRFLIIDGASHFSPIRVNNEFDKEEIGEDVFKIKENFIGSRPYDVQNLSLKIIIQFLEGLNKKRKLEIVKSQRSNNLNFYVLGEKEIYKIYQD